MHYHQHNVDVCHHQVRLVMAMTISDDDDDDDDDDDFDDVQR